MRSCLTQFNYTHRKDNSACTGPPLSMIISNLNSTTLVQIYGQNAVCHPKPFNVISITVNHHKSTVIHSIFQLEVWPKGRKVGMQHWCYPPATQHKLRSHTLVIQLHHWVIENTQLQGLEVLMRNIMPAFQIPYYLIYNWDISIIFYIWEKSLPSG